jgi:hypothetical protein
MRYLLVLLLCHLAWPSLAEESFDLFDAERGKEKPPPLPAQPPVEIKPPVTPPKPALPAPPQKDFTLEGTSRIGARVSAMLVAPDGKKVMQTLRDNQATPIKGYEEFKLLSVDARQVEVLYPENSPCRASNLQRGIQCGSDGKSATLNLLNARALPPSAPPPVPIQPGQPAPMDNPFAAALQQANQQANQQAGQPPGALNPFAPQPSPVGMTGNPPLAPGQAQPDFRPQRIRDEDVPPGMKVIRTPFGDRLVPEQR